MPSICCRMRWTTEPEWDTSLSAERVGDHTVLSSILLPDRIYAESALFSGTVSSSLWATDSDYWVEIPMSTERQVRTTALCTVTVVSVTQMKDFSTGSAMRKGQNDNSPFSYFNQLLCTQQTYWLHNNHSGWRHWGYNNKEVTCGLDLTHVTCVTQIQPLFPGTLFPLSCKQCIFIIVSPN